MASPRDPASSASESASTTTRSEAAAAAAAAATNDSENVPPFIQGPASLLSTDARLAKADEIVTRNSRWAGGLGLIPVPVVDIIAVTGFQLKMLRELTAFYGEDYQEEWGKRWIAALIGGFTPSTIGLSVASWVKAVPLVGFTASLLAMPAFSYASTYAVGKVFTRHFEEGGTLLTLDPKKSASLYAQMFKEGTSRRQART